MRTKTVLAAAVVFFAGVSPCFAADLQMGTWKLNEGKSQLPAGTSRGVTVTYAAAGDSVKVTVDGLDKDGKPAHNEWTGKYDGKDYPVVGDPNTDTRAYKKVDDRTLELTGKKDGKVSVTGRIVVSPDGKTRTVTLTTTDPSGKQMTSTAVYDKQ
ncbi:MAG TPA: hypothetical protein VFM88_23495 [Vicinamibacteria bacterium]|nr:hypothetical protein [Vicinamibacteria bacterium]